MPKKETFAKEDIPALAWTTNAPIIPTLAICEITRLGMPSLGAVKDNRPASVDAKNVVFTDVYQP